MTRLREDAVTPVEAALVITQDTSVFVTGFVCQYVAQAIVFETAQEKAFVAEPGYVAKVEAIIKRYEACKGAIGILAANVNISSSTCTF